MNKTFRFALSLHLWAVFVPLSAPLRSSAAAAKNSPANIVLIVIDTLRADHLGCYGYPRPTSPHIDRLAQDGALFSQCYSSASWTLPAMLSMFTGVPPAAHGAVRHDTALPASVPILAESLQKKGYFCAAVVANPFLNGKYGFSRGFDKYDDFSIFLDAELAQLASETPREAPLLSERVTGDLVLKQSKRLLQQATASGKPFFLFIHFYDPHDSYIPPRPFARSFLPAGELLVDGRGLPVLRQQPPTGAALDQLIGLYDGEIAFTDSKVGAFIEDLDRSVRPESTLILLTSDHGEAFGEHGSLLHGNTPHVEEARVPLIARWTGQVVPRRIDAPVSTLDLAATLKELAQLTDFQPPFGVSLIPALRGAPPDQDRPVLTETAFQLLPAAQQPQHVALTLGHMRLHTRFSRSPAAQESPQFQLYDLSADPLETKNLAPDHPQDIANLSSRLLSLWEQASALRRQIHPSGVPARVNLDPKEDKRIRGLGYLEQAPKP